jgi:hypothetical protein
VALLTAAATAVSACGDTDAPRVQATPTPPPAAAPAAGDGELAVGITEPNPNLVRPGAVAPEFTRWRDELQRIRPAYYRLHVDWTGATTPDGATVDLARHHPGCMRAIAPCGGFNGIRDQLAAVAAAQRAAGGGRWQVMVVISGTPDRLAAPPAGCERPRTQPRSRPPGAAGLTRYQELIAALLDEARAQGVDLRWWSPWNEPNHPGFIAGQRARCSAGARTLAVDRYVEIARAMQAALAAYPGDQQLVLGETAGLLRRKRTYTDVGQFIRGLPSDLVCSTTVYGQHGYVGDADPVDEVAAALGSFGCPRPHEIWITETGTNGGARPEACANVRRRLLQWYADPRVTAAFQYTLREDDRFPTGLVTTDLTAAYPVLAEWQAWGDREPAAPPPPSTCAT